MNQIILIGCGALGSTFLSEFSKRQFATSQPIVIAAVDFDNVEERNLVSQEFLPTDLGKNKAECLAARYSNSVTTIQAHNKRADDGVIREIMSQMDPNYPVVLVDAVDNATTRIELWSIANALRIPCLHMGMSDNGDGHGVVEWNYEDHDRFHLSPKDMTPGTYRKIMEGGEAHDKLPPCMLGAFRPMIFLTALAGVQALNIFFDQDAGSYLAKKVDQEIDSTLGFMVGFETTKESIALVTEGAAQRVPVSTVDRARLDAEAQDGTKKEEAAV